MTLPASGAVSAWQLNVEVGRGGNASGSAGEQVFRDLAEVGGGSYSGLAFFGKSMFKPLAAQLSTYLSETTFTMGIGRPRVFLEVSCTPKYGQPPYSFAWEMLWEDGNHPVFSGEFTDKITFTGDPRGKGSDWRCKVTDGSGQVAYSPNLQIRFYFKKLNIGM
ncbi:hypothetical protein [Chromobacterium sphagni]|uniref:Ig-like domain-containing protein n=1 Tax=Chromobacterium sphagni TaxID=1903179 RepID=A0ABX3CEK2_9NEIS|nr:hypothetical protein [Chromobacterium sphagni]OHX20521.1 hypothetical protein BI344_08660 [Chromobacterium sphagni]